MHSRGRGFKEMLTFCGGLIWMVLYQRNKGWNWKTRASRARALPFRFADGQSVLGGQALLWPVTLTHDDCMTCSVQPGGRAGLLRIHLGHNICFKRWQNSYSFQQNSCKTSGYKNVVEPLSGFQKAFSCRLRASQPNMSWPEWTCERETHRKCNHTGDHRH